MQNEKKPGRLVALDYLRGYFMLVIIIDHLYRWPSALSILTGQSLLWFNAADGFVIISGLMIGYVRGYKGMKLPMRSITGKLWRRAALLYLWLIIATVFYTGFAWLFPTSAPLPYIPIANGEWLTLVQQIVTLQYAHVWVNFLYLYTIFLAIAPLAIWLLRKNLAWMVAIISVTGYLIGDVENIKWLQWQILFFLPVIAGFYLEAIRSWWRAKPARRHYLTITILSSTATIIIVSALLHFALPATPTVNAINTYFSKDHIQIGSILAPFIVFGGLVILFNKLEPFLERKLTWLLLPFGTQSLTVYIVHGVLLILITYTVPVSESIIVNTLSGIAAVMGTWGLLKLPWVQRFIPR